MSDDYEREERAAIYEYMAGMSREEAERLVWWMKCDRSSSDET